MAKIIVVHYTEKARIPKLTMEKVAEFKAEVRKSLSENPDVRLEGLFVNPEGIGFGLLEAPDVEAVRKVVEGSGPGYYYDLITVVEDVKP